MQKRLLIIGGVGLALLLAVVVIGLLVMQYLRFAPKFFNTNTLLQQVQSLSQLVTVKYVMEKVVVLEDPPKTVLGQFFTGESRVIMVAHGVVKAGVDLARLGPDDLKLSGTHITIKMPAPSITDVYLDDKKTEILEHKTGLLRNYDREMEQNARRHAVEEIRTAAKYNGILTEADTRARDQLRQLFTGLGLTVEFK